MTAEHAGIALYAAGAILCALSVAFDVYASCLPQVMLAAGAVLWLEGALQIAGAIAAPHILGFGWLLLRGGSSRGAPLADERGAEGAPETLPREDPPSR